MPPSTVKGLYRRCYTRRGLREESDTSTVRGQFTTPVVGEFGSVRLEILTERVIPYRVYYNTLKTPFQYFYGTLTVERVNPMNHLGPWCNISSVRRGTPPMDTQITSSRGGPQGQLLVVVGVTLMYSEVH